MAALHDSDRAWKTFAQTEAYYAVCTDEEFRNENLSDGNREKFFQSGESHIRSLLRIIREQLVSDFQPADAVDFGCGVGRLVMPLARQCREVFGIDVAPAMLEESAKNCRERGFENVRFVSAPDQLPAGRTFDLVHTYIVLQHIPTARGTALFGALVDRVAEGGVGVLHVTYHREASSARKWITRLRRNVPLVHNFLNLLKGWSFSRPLMQMNEYSLSHLFSLLQKKNCHNLVLRFTDHDGYYGAVIMFQKKRCADFL